MVSIIKQKHGTKIYYYLTHHNSKRIKRQNIGTVLPKNIEELKESFLLGFYREDWIPKLDAIKSGFSESRIRNSAGFLSDFSISFTYHTNKIEGSKLTRLDTVRLLRDGMTPIAKPSSDMIESKLAHAVFLDMITHQKKLSLDTIRAWHISMFNQTKIDSAGHIREEPIHVEGSRAIFPPGEEVFDRIVEFFRWYQKAKKNTHPVELAGIAHHRFEAIHPFEDGNGRIGRLIMNCILDEAGFPMLNIEYSDRTAYYKALERSDLKKSEIPFLKWFVNYYIKKNKKFSGKS